VNKRNFVTGFTPDKADFDALQDDLESGINFTAAAVAGMGIKEGFDVSLSGSNAVITAGEGFDGLGRPLKSTVEITLNLGTIPRPASGSYKWITVALKYKVKEEGTVIDISNTTWPYLIKDSLEVIILEGNEETLENIIKPNYEEYQVPILDIRMDDATPIENLFSEGERKPVIYSMEEISERLNSILNICFPVGFTYAQYPDGKTPAGMGYPGTWTAKFETEGIFFRTPGGKALSFEGGIQEHATQRITAFLSQFFCSTGTAATGAFSVGSFSAMLDTSSGGYGQRSLSFDSADSISPNVNNTDDDESRPRNRTYRIWERTA